MISQLRQRVLKNGQAIITAEEYDQLQREWITRTGAEDMIVAEREACRRAIDASVKGTYDCPICGYDKPHKHTDRELECGTITIKPLSNMDNFRNIKFCEMNAKGTEIIAAPAICQRCGIRHTAPTTGRIENRCSLCGGTLIPEVAAQ